MSELDALLGEQVDRLLSDAVDRESLEQAELGDWPAALWQHCDDHGLPLALVGSEAGGAGLSWADAAPVLIAAGRHHPPIPLVETMIGAHLLARTGQDVPPGPIAIGPVRAGERLGYADGRVSGRISRIPWGRQARHLVAIAEGEEGAQLVLLETASAAHGAGRNLAREPRDRLAFDGAEVLSSRPTNDGEAIFRLGALARAAQIAGALDHLLDESVRYAGDRVQFGRPIAKFQAVQQELARLAGEVAASSAAVDGACRAVAAGDGWFEIAAAKARTSEAASTGAAIAHQTHGAIGFTYEHRLHFATRRLWSWRAEFGNETYWSRRLGDLVAEAGGDALWATMCLR